MNVQETLTYLADRVQIAIVIGSVPTDGSGNIEILHANSPASSLFGYSGPPSMKGLDVRSLMPPEIAKDHRGHVGGYVERANGGKVRSSSIMGSWRKVQAVRYDGSRVSVEANVCDIRNSEERYFVAFFKDRTEIEAEMQRADEAVKLAEEAREKAEKLAKEAETARVLAEEGALKQQRLSGQVTLLRQIFTGTMGLVVMLGLLVVAQWSTGSEGEGLSMIKDVLLVLTGILGSAMASVFDSRGKSSE